MRKGGREYRDYLRDILYAVERAESFTEGMDFAAFEADEKTAFAVVRALEIVGEAAKKIPPRSARNTPIFPGARWRECETSLSTITSGWTSGGSSRPCGEIFRPCAPLLKRCSGISARINACERSGAEARQQTLYSRPDLVEF